MHRFTDMHRSSDVHGLMVMHGLAGVHRLSRTHRLVSRTDYPRKLARRARGIDIHVPAKPPERIDVLVTLSEDALDQEWRIEP